MAVASVGGVQSLWAAPVVATVIPVLWPRVASVRIMMTRAEMFLKMTLWSGSALPVSFFMVVSWTWSGMAMSGRFVMNYWGSWRRYLVWTIHDNVTIFTALIASNIWGISCYMSLFLALETVISLCDITSTVEGGMIIAVTCCTALSLSTSEIASVSICGPFSQMWVAKLWAFFNPLIKILMVVASFVKLHLLASVLNL